MPQLETFHDAFLDELRDIYDAEKQIARALPRMVKAASSDALRSAFEEHLEVTKQQVERLEEVFESLDQRARGKRCKGIAGILEEGKESMQEDFEETAKDAVLIAGGQRVEHYEIAAYGTLAAWARAMGHTEAAELLEQSLQEEKEADEKLNQLAESSINPEAASRAHGMDGEAEEESSARGSRRRSSGSRSRGSMSRPATRRSTKKSKAKR